MAKEALAILDNLAHFCSAVPQDENLLSFKIELLINTGHADKAAALYGLEANSYKGTEAGKTMEEIFAALILAGKESILDALPEDFSLVAHASFAVEALNAYCSKEDERAIQQLKKIPSRSPYRNLTLALKGLLLISADVPAALRIFVKIPPESPFYAIVASFVAYSKTDKPLGVTLAEINPTELKLLVAARGFDERRVACLIDLVKAQNNPQKQIALLGSQRKELGILWARQACRALLPLAPDRTKIYEKYFGRMTGRELYRLQALTYEHHLDLELAVDMWKRVIASLQKEPDSAENKLSLALIYRHLAEIIKDVDPYEFIQDIDGDYAAYLQQSLIYDPVDKATYLQLFDCYSDDKKALRQCLIPALEHCPQDVDILLRAAEFSLECNAFKKTSRYAKDILELDPINSKVRNLLQRAHLSHGRKLCKAGKLELALREFSLAQEQQRSQSHKGTAIICQGLVQILAKDESSGQAMTEHGRQLVGLPCKAWLITAVEGRLMGLPPQQCRKIARQLKTCNQTNLTKAEFFELLEQFKTYMTQAPVIMKSMIGHVQPLFKKSADLGYTQEESRSLCDYFYHARHFDLLQPFALVAQKYWSSQPIFSFYRLYAKAKGIHHNLSNRDLMRLDLIHTQAEEQNDDLVTNLIMEFVEYFPMNTPFNPFINDEDDIDGPIKLINSIIAEMSENDGKNPIPEKRRGAKKGGKTTPDHDDSKQEDPSGQMEMF